MTGPQAPGATPVVVLLIEDNDANAYLVRYLLEHQGWVVHRACDGQQALGIAPIGGLALVLLDIQLPDMDGYELARRLRLLPALHDVPIVALTSHALVGDRERALAAGCDEYIEKPIDPLTFAETLRRVLARTSGGAHGSHPGQ
jgi:CheY-like chemotaxis protein